MPTPEITSIKPQVFAGIKDGLDVLGSNFPKNVRLVLVEAENNATVEIGAQRRLSANRVVFPVKFPKPQTLTFVVRWQDKEQNGVIEQTVSGLPLTVEAVPHPAIYKYRGLRVLPLKLAAILVGMILLALVLTKPRSIQISASPAQIAAGKISEVMVEFSKPVDLENRHWFKLPEDILVWDNTILSPTQCLLKVKTSDVSSGERVIYLQGINGSFVLTVAQAPLIKNSNIKGGL